MKKCLLFFCALVLASGCATTVRKNFTVVVDPPDAKIKVVASKDDVQEYQSPASVSVPVPNDRVLQARAMVEITKDSYKPKRIPVRTIQEGETVNVTLERISHYQLTLRLLSPVKAEEFAFRDKTIALSSTATDQGFNMSLSNVGAVPIKILWNQAELRDLNGRQHRLMHSGIRYQDRNNPAPAQTIAPGGSVQQAVLRTSAVVYSQEWKMYEIQPIFPVEGGNVEALKGKIFYIFIPIEVDRQIIPYSFKVEIVDAVKG